VIANLFYTVRYFLVVSPVSTLMVTSFAVVSVAGTVIAAAGGRDAARAVVPILVLQAFAAATGFTAPARRGYFDLLLARGESRARIATTQWLAAIMPGCLSWLSLAMAIGLWDRHHANPMLANGTVVALVLVSTVPWAVTVSLPRFSGAIGWLLVVSLGSIAGFQWPDAMHHLFYPIGLIGEDLRGRPGVALPPVLASAISMSVALWWVDRSDIPLEAAQ
jgi:hypothetical protein